MEHVKMGCPPPLLSPPGASPVLHSDGCLASFRGDHLPLCLWTMRVCRQTTLAGTVVSGGQAQEANLWA